MQDVWNRVCKVMANDGDEAVGKELEIIIPTANVTEVIVRVWENLEKNILEWKYYYCFKN